MFPGKLQGGSDERADGAMHCARSFNEANAAYGSVEAEKNNSRRTIAPLWIILPTLMFVLESNSHENRAKKWLATAKDPRWNGPIRTSPQKSPKVMSTA